MLHLAQSNPLDTVHDCADYQASAAKAEAGKR